MKIPRFRLSHLLQRDANNLDLIRLICAGVVIFGHSFVLVKDPTHPPEAWDPCKYLSYPGVYSASVAVKVFFFISGLLVTNSLLEKKSVTGYLCGRFFRIWPAYTVVLLITAFVVGPFFSTFLPREYFVHPQAYAYPAFNLMMISADYLPGVFGGNPMRHLVNGALWSLPYEVGAYLILLLVFLIGIHRSLLLSTALFLLFMIDPLLPHSILFPWRQFNPQLSYVPPCFAFGAYLALIKNRLTIGWESAAGLTVAFLFLKSSRFGPLVFFITLFILLLYFSGFAFVRRLKLPFDCSYGTYLWGFVIQQMIAAKFAEKGLVFNLIWSLVAAVLAGILSWYLIERPAIAAGRRFAKLMKRPKSPVFTEPVAAGELVL